MLPPFFLVEAQTVEETPTTTTEAAAPATIDTGNAVSETEINNGVNPNEADISTGEESTLAPEDTSLSGDQINLGDSSTTASSTNVAEVTNTLLGTAETGNNNATSTSNSTDGTNINTGIAYATANVINVVNSNIFNSEGFLYLLNNFLGGLGNIDLRLSSLSLPINSCSDPSCDGSLASIRTNVESTNEATITNDVVLRASTGDNTASGNGSSINTGSAYAGANVVNIANTNIINSNYLMFVFNNFGDWSGDLVFNNKDFFSSFFNPNSTTNNSHVDINNQNSASITNNVQTDSSSGNNSASSTEADINTGNSLSNSNVVNAVNQNIFGESNFILVFRIFGDWAGSVFNAPSNIKWANTSNGVEVYDSGSGVGTSTAGSGDLSVNNQNTANINNNVKVLALTGNNRVSGSTNTSINTGSAYAGSNVVNVANTNIVSSNWILAVVNIFGNWRGNVSFGQPDLWVASRVDNSGSSMTVRTTVANRGDADAHNIELKHKIDANYLIFTDTDDPLLMSKKISLLKPGQTIEYVYNAQVTENVPQGDNFLPSSLSVKAIESDGNLKDNEDELLITYYNKPIFVAPLNLTSYTTTYPNLFVTKTNDAKGPIEASSTVNYTIKIKNSGGESFESVLIDDLKDSEGRIINKQSWDLGTILAGEEITITYTALFSSTTAPGVYTNFAHVEALGGDYKNHWALATKADSPTVSSSVTINPMREGDLVATSSSPVTSWEDQGTVKSTPTGTLRNGPQANETLGETIHLELKSSDKKNKFDVKHLLASVFSVILLIRPKKEYGSITML